MVLWKYRFFSEITNTFEEGKPQKIPFVWASDAPDADYDLVNDQALILEKIKDLYYSYEVDGKDYFRDIRAQLVLDYKSGSRSSADIFEIESILNLVISNLLLGDWLTASYHMSLITPAGALDQALYDEINDHITNYINENYT